VFNAAICVQCRKKTFATVSANKRLMHGSKELKLFDHFVGAGEGKMRDCNLSLMQPEHAVHGA
jgi:hypothetical protein